MDAADIDNDGMYEMVFGAPSSTVRVYDIMVDRGAVYLTDEALTVRDTIFGDVDFLQENFGLHAQFVTTPRGHRIAANIRKTHGDIITFIDPLRTDLDGAEAGDVYDARIEGSADINLPETVTLASPVRGEVWIGTRHYPDVLTGPCRLVLADLDVEDATTFELPVLGEAPGGGYGANVVGNERGTLVSQELADGAAGAAHWFSADATDFSLTEASRSWHGLAPYDLFGVSIALLNDPMGSLVVVGSPADSSDHARGGRVYVLDPESADPSLEGALAVIHSSRDGDFVGRQVLAPGDLDGDGIDDLVVAAPWDVSLSPPDRGAVYIFRGPLRGDIELDDADWAFYGTQDNELTGFSLAAGHFDDDGRLDLAIGRPWYDDRQGLEMAGRVDQVLNKDMVWR